MAIETLHRLALLLMELLDGTSLIHWLFGDVIVMGKEGWFEALGRDGCDGSAGL